MDDSEIFDLNVKCKRKQEDRDAMPHKRSRNKDADQKCRLIMTQALPSDSLSSIILADSSVNNFRQSGLPRRFMFYEKGEWKDYPNHVIMAISVCFMAHKTCLNFVIDEIHGTPSYTVNFVYMLQLNTHTGYVRSVAWIDDHGKCFSPPKCVEGSYGVHQDWFLVSSDPHKEVPLPTIIKSEFQQQCLKNSTPPAIYTASREADSSSLTEGTHIILSHELNDRVVKLDETNNKHFEFVKEKFVHGLALLAKHTTISAIYKVSHNNTTLGFKARLKAFMEQEEATKETRGGNANVRWGWHGTSKEGVKDILMHGFRQTKVPKNGTNSYGAGVYLSPEDYPRISAMYSNVDENGEQHMILCKVVLGKSEQINPGSHQFHPSSEEYDTGVDELENPKRYIVWSTHMNTRILPEFIVTFKLSPPLRAVMVAALGGKKLRVCLSPSILNVQKSCIKGLTKCDDKASPCKSPCSPWISFPELFSMMRPKLSPKHMLALEQEYHDFHARKMSRDVFVKKIRSMVGDDILRQCLARKNNALNAASVKT